MLDNPVFVVLVLPAVFAAIIVALVSIKLRHERSAILRVFVPAVCGIAFYVLMVILLQEAGIKL